MLLNKETAKKIDITLRRSGFNQQFQINILYKFKKVPSCNTGYYSNHINLGKFKIEWLEIFIEYFSKYASISLAKELKKIKEGLSA